MVSKNSRDAGLLRYRWVASTIRPASRSGAARPANSAMTAPSLCPQRTGRSSPSASITAEGFGRGQLVEVHRLTLEPPRSAVPGPVGNDHTMSGREGGQLPVERIDLVAPAAVQNHERPSGACIAIVDADGRHAGRER